MVENSSPGKKKIIKNRRNTSRLKNELNYTANKDIRNLCRQEKKTKEIKDRILRDFKSLFEHEKVEENYCQPVRVSNFWRTNYIEYESNSTGNKTLSVEKCLNKIRPYLKDTINNIKTSATWKIQLAIANNVLP